MNESNQKFDLWCLVELFGHSKIAGKCTEQNIAGTNMLRVDVPETSKQPAFTRFFGSGAIYAINPMDEEAVGFYADKLEIAPIQSYNISELVKKHSALLLEKSQTTNHAEVDEDINTGKDDDDDDEWDDDHLDLN